MSTIWSVINETARGDVVDIKPRIDLVRFVDNSRTDISSDVLQCDLNRDFKNGITGSMRVTKKYGDPEFWASHAVNPTLQISTASRVGQIKLGLLTARSYSEGYADASVGLQDVMVLHKQPQQHPFSTAPEGSTGTATTTPQAALSRIRELTAASNIVGSLDHKGFEPTTLLNPNPDISATDTVEVRGYQAGSELLCELERLLSGIGWRPPWTTRRGLLTSEPYCSPCDTIARARARELPASVIYEESFNVTTNLLAPNSLRVLDSDGSSAERQLNAGEDFSEQRIGRSIPAFQRARNPDDSIDPIWAASHTPRRRVKFRCASPGVFWHRDVFKLNYGALRNVVCVVSRWRLGLISGQYSVEADVCE